MVIPEGQAFGASGKLGADHASLFFTAKDYLARSQMYDPGVDPWGRTAETFPPHVVFLTAYSTARFDDFVSSALLNNFVQILLFAIVSAYFVRGGPSPWMLRAAGAVAGAFLLFCTPVGVTWFERAQTDLYCASAIVLLLKGMRDDTWSDFLLAGLLASFKWSCLPFFALAAIPYIVLASERRLRKAVLIGVSLSVPFLLLIFFGADATRYLMLVYQSENGLFDGTTGISLTWYFPKVIAKVVPFAVPGLFVLCAKVAPRRTARPSSELVFWATTGLVAVAFATTAYEYRLLSVIFILPLVIDGRSVLFARQHVMSSTAGRIIGLVFLAYAFRVETLDFVDMLVSSRRAIVPLLVGGALIPILSLLESDVRALVERKREIFRMLTFHSSSSAPSSHDDDVRG